MTDRSSLSRAACAELLERLDHFALKPRVVLDLGGGVTDGAPDPLRRRFSTARILVTGAGVAAPNGLVQGALDALRRLVPGTASALERIDGTPKRLSLTDGSVDLLLGHWLAPGTESLDAVLAELRRVLAPGGLFLWTTPGLGASPEPIDLHDLGSALTRAGFLEPVLDVDRLVPTGVAAQDGGARCEVIHAAAFAGQARRMAPREGADDPGETFVPLDALQRRRVTTPEDPPR